MSKHGSSRPLSGCSLAGFLLTAKDDCGNWRFQDLDMMTPDNPRGQFMRLFCFHAGARLLFVMTTTFFIGCGGFAARELSGMEVADPEDFRFVGKMSPCFLELAERSRAFRVNCFHIDGVLHIHSSRWAKLPRFSGENWTVTVRRNPEVRVEIEGKIYALQASPIDDDSLRMRILHDRGYWYAWEGITIVRFLPHHA